MIVPYRKYTCNAVLPYRHFGVALSVILHG